MNGTRARPVILPLSAAVLLVAGVGACASSRAPAGPAMAVFVEVNNDITPPADLEIFVYPVGGDELDRIRLGVVAGASTRRFDATVLQDGWYYLQARRVLEVPAVPLPVGRPSVTSRWTTRRFVVRAETREMSWRVDTNSLAVGDGSGGG